jgi:TPR repeat protein
MRHFFYIMSLAFIAMSCGLPPETDGGQSPEAAYTANIARAKEGDPVAQYKVGNALCCGTNKKPRFHNTREAIYWLCSSAAHQYGPAMYRLGQIYSGAITPEGLASEGHSGDLNEWKNLPVAYVWFSNAQAHGVKKADQSAKDVWTEMSVEGRKSAMAMAEHGLKASCGSEDLRSKTNS